MVFALFPGQRKTPEEKSYQETVWETYLEKHKEAAVDNVNHPVALHN